MLALAAVTHELRRLPTSRWIICVLRWVATMNDTSDTIGHAASLRKTPLGRICAYGAQYSIPERHLIYTVRSFQAPSLNHLYDNMQLTLHARDYNQTSLERSLMQEAFGRPGAA